MASTLPHGAVCARCGEPAARTLSLKAEDGGVHTMYVCKDCYNTIPRPVPGKKA
jgi:hypothetical protein